MNYQKCVLNFLSSWLANWQGQSWRVIKCWYTGGDPEQGFRRCFADRLKQSLVSSVVQATWRKLLPFWPPKINFGIVWRKIGQEPPSGSVGAAPRRAARELSNLDLCLFSFIASSVKFVFWQYIIDRKLIISAFTQGYALAVNMSLKRGINGNGRCATNSQIPQSSRLLWRSIKGSL